MNWLFCRCVFSKSKTTHLIEYFLGNNFFHGRTISCKLVDKHFLFDQSFFISQNKRKKVRSIKKGSNERKLFPRRKTRTFSESPEPASFTHTFGHRRVNKRPLKQQTNVMWSGFTTIALHRSVMWVIIFKRACGKCHLTPQLPTTLKTGVKLSARYAFMPDSWLSASQCGLSPTQHQLDSHNMFVLASFFSVQCSMHHEKQKFSAEFATYLLLGAVDGNWGVGGAGKIEGWRCKQVLRTLFPLKFRDHQIQTF